MTCLQIIYTDTVTPEKAFFMEPIIETIKKRISCRTYSDRPVEPRVKAELLDFIHSNTITPFGNIVRFHLIDLTEAEKDEMKSFGTYRVIKGARLFIAGTITRGTHAMEDYGYCMEKNILHATARGLGTCWLGGTFKKTGFAGRIGVTHSELLPAVTPVGYPAVKKSLMEKVFRFAASSHKRKPWDELFFHGNPQTPLDAAAAESYADVLECVRLAPAASNKQPWRIIKDPGGTTFHFYLERTKGYDTGAQDIHLQNIDMGIALCHFDLAAQERRLRGTWKDAPADRNTGQWEYIMTWTEKS